MTKKYRNFSLKSATKSKETFQFIKLCKGDMNRRPKTAKINLGLNHRVTFRSRPYMTSQAEYLEMCVN